MGVTREGLKVDWEALKGFEGYEISKKTFEVRSVDRYIKYSNGKTVFHNKVQHI